MQSGFNIGGKMKKFGAVIASVIALIDREKGVIRTKKSSAEAMRNFGATCRDIINRRDKLDLEDALSEMLASASALDIHVSESMRATMLGFIQVEKDSRARRQQYKVALVRSKIRGRALGLNKSGKSNATRRFVSALIPRYGAEQRTLR
jgi:hypothetical protein